MNALVQVGDDFGRKVVFLRFRSALAFGLVLGLIFAGKVAKLDEALSADRDRIAGSSSLDLFWGAILDRAIVVMIAVAVGAERLALDDRRSARATPAATGIVPASIEVEWIMCLAFLPMCDQLSRARPGLPTFPQTWQQTSSIVIPIRSGFRQPLRLSFRKKSGISLWIGLSQSVG